MLSIILDAVLVSLLSDFVNVELSLEDDDTDTNFVVGPFDLLLDREDDVEGDSNAVEDTKLLLVDEVEIGEELLSPKDEIPLSTLLELESV